MIVMNGKTFQGNSISINNGRVIIDGKEAKSDDKVINITVDGRLEKLNADVCNTITVKGTCGMVKTMSGDVDIKGNVDGDVKTMSGDVKCGTISGSVSSMSGNIKNKK